MPVPTPAPAPLRIDEQKMGEVQALKEKVEAERAKPAADQNFAELKKAIAVIAGDKQSPRAARKRSGIAEDG